MGGISSEQGVLYLCVNVCILMTGCDTWINELQLIRAAVCVCMCVSVCVRDRESVRMCMLVHHPALYSDSSCRLIYVPQASIPWTTA